jgi:hypothetical protein
LLNENFLLFFDKKDLTNGIDWFIPCAMNANEISPKANPRLNRIRTVSRIVKWAIFALGSFSIVFVVVFSYGSFPKNNIWNALFLFSFQIVICLWY